MNYLFDRDTEPYATPDQIAEFFGVSKSTVGQKAKQIRDMFKLRHWDPEFSTEQVRRSNPFRYMVMVDGLVVPASMLPAEVQEELRRRGIIED